MMTARRRSQLLAIALAAAVAACQGCKKAPFFKDAADREVRRIIAEKQDKVPGTPASFGIEPPEEAELKRFTPPRPRATEPTTALSDEDLDAADKGNGLPAIPDAVRLTLREALQLAARHSRDYQSRREDLYLSALDLTLERFRWNPQWTGVLSAGATRDPDKSWAETGTSFTVSQLLALGGKVTASLATDLILYSTGDPRTTATSLLTLEYLQPLWRKHGRLVAMEPLTQAERNTVYALRTFARYRKSFCVDATSRYYRVLQQRDAVLNQWNNYKRIRQSRRDAEALARVGEKARLELDQTRQDELRALANWVRAVRQYREQLDQFKVFLGLPADAPVELDAAEVEKLREAGLREVTLSPEAAVGIALSRRLDLLTALDKVADAERAVEIAKNGLAPDVDLKVNVSVPTEPNTHFLTFEPHRSTYSAGLRLGLPLQRLQERNTYRSALIALDRARRSADELREQIKLSVRDAWRTLQEAATSYRIERDSVELAARRERAARELIRLGEATARDLLEANEALVNAQNALTRTLVDHTLARLALWRDTELLHVNEDGVWEDVANVER